MNAAPLIQLRDVGKSFDGGRSFAVRHASLDVAAESFVALLGATGAGKTTLLKMINRLVGADAGEIRIEDGSIEAVDPPTLRRRIGYVFQGAGLFPHMSVEENIGVTPHLLRWPAKRIAARIAELLDLVELPRSYGPRLPATLSGGERQRVAVARAIAADPRIVLMDEPFGALDPITRNNVGQAYRRLHDRLGLTTIMVTHDAQEAMLLADRIAVMSAGRVLAYDTPAALMAEAAEPAVADLIAMP